MRGHLWGALSVAVALASLLACGDDEPMMEEYEPLPCVGELEIPDENLRALLLEVVPQPSAVETESDTGETDTSGTDTDTDT
ncbi:MAG: hypothetical protein KC636_34260, partial [Myxococcales bacterium]|nr:hypothetical protein [Myxococcales bacterium]